ncbi:MAG: alanine--tRNA ligase [Candidatus Bathyarchaeia archaeon]
MLGRRRPLPPTIFEVQVFKREGFVRKVCPSCGRAFWTLKEGQERCGDQPCVEYAFIGASPVPRPYEMGELREAFLSFFEKHGHRRIRRYPVAARWRNDVYLVGASIYDFQPWVTEGLSAPPGNPLVISQPCIRFTDLENVGKTGRHLTGFEMMAHHAFNFPGRLIYWTDETVEYGYRFFTEALSIPAEELSFVEDWWEGGGNAGEDLEVATKGLEVATLVFMHYKTVNGDREPLAQSIVDTGYGLERLLWLTKGSTNIYEAVSGLLVERLRVASGVPKLDEYIAGEISKAAGLMEFKGAASLQQLRARVAERVGLNPAELRGLIAPYEAIYAVVDHANSLAWMLKDSIVPSNTAAGYLARLLIRRSLRLLAQLQSTMDFKEVLAYQLDRLARDFPEFKEGRDIILDMLSVEEERYAETQRRGLSLVARRAQELLKEGSKTLPAADLVTFYESHGIPPETVSEEAEKLGLKVELPDDFYVKLAQGHERPKPPAAEETAADKLRAQLVGLPETEAVYYADAYTQRFEARVETVVDGRYVVLNRTAFYPEGGGQLADTGILRFNGRETRVVDARKVGQVIVHTVEGEAPSVGSQVVGEVDWARRRQLMQHHTGTHILGGAARRILGEHIWQTGAEKGVDKARLDITHYKRIPQEELCRIEKLANQVVFEARPVRVEVMPREKAEEKYGFRLYQGGFFPGREVRVVETQGWDVEACGGTHLKNTAEVGFIKILRAERIQDGVERIEFAAGEAALKHVQESERLLREASKALNVPVERLPQAAASLLADLRKARKEAEELLAGLKRGTGVLEPKHREEIEGLQVEVYASPTEADRLVAFANAQVNEQPNLVVVAFSLTEPVKLVVMAGNKAVERGIHAGRLVSRAAAAAQGAGGGTARLGQGGALAREKMQEAEELMLSLIKDTLTARRVK